MRGTILVANWKANPKTLRDAKTLFSSFTRTAKNLSRTTLVICPPGVFLASLALSYRGGAINFGSQDVSSEADGAHTGEVSASMLKSVGARYVIIGHSERRAMGETNERINKKIQRAATAGLVSVLCVGERERDTEAHFLEEIRRQLLSAIEHLTPQQLKKITIAYEPVWAIGKSADDAMSPRDLHQMVLFIRKTLSEQFGPSVMATPILYGGSVEPANALALMRESGVGGFLVGHASLSSEPFLSIMEAVDGRARLA